MPTPRTSARPLAKSSPRSDRIALGLRRVAAEPHHALAVSEPEPVIPDAVRRALTL